MREDVPEHFLNPFSRYSKLLINAALPSGHGLLLHPASDAGSWQDAH